jgi:predicted esterase
MIPRFFRRLAEGVFDIEDLKLRTNELADFVEKASLQPMGLMQEMSWRLVTQMMPILL